MRISDWSSDVCSSDLLLLEAALAQQDVLGRHPDVLEIQLAPVVAADVAHRLAEGEARRAALDQHRADSVDAAAVADIDQEQLGVRAVRSEHLGAVEDRKSTRLNSSH